SVRAERAQLQRVHESWRRLLAPEFRRLDRREAGERVVGLGGVEHRRVVREPLPLREFLGGHAPPPLPRHPPPTSDARRAARACHRRSRRASVPSSAMPYARCSTAMTTWRRGSSRDGGGMKRSHGSTFRKRVAQSNAEYTMPLSGRPRRGATTAYS